MARPGPIGIKICGLSTRASVAAAVGAGASHIGFVFYPRSPRNVTPDQALVLGAHLARPCLRVGVFVDPDDALLAATAGRGAIDIIQLHGRESPGRLGAIKSAFGLPVWKAIPVAGSADVGAAGAFAGVADLLLFDAKPPTAAPSGPLLPGGMGLRFDWRLLAGKSWRCAWGLSGGLDADVVAQAIAELAPPLLDVSSGVEDEPGVKSVAKIEAFVAAVRAAAQGQGQGQQL